MGMWGTRRTQSIRNIRGLATLVAPYHHPSPFFFPSPCATSFTHFSHPSSFFLLASLVAPHHHPSLHFFFFFFNSFKIKWSNGFQRSKTRSFPCQKNSRATSLPCGTVGMAAVFSHGTKVPPSSSRDRCRSPKRMLGIRFEMILKGLEDLFYVRSITTGLIKA